jgi:hypothetical protein
MRCGPRWGIVDNRYEATGYKDELFTLRAGKLWLPTIPFLTINFGETEDYHALAAASGFARRLGNLHVGHSDLNGPEYTGMLDSTLLQLFHRLSSNADMAAQNPSLILTDGLAEDLEGTKTSNSSKYI